MLHNKSNEQSHSPTSPGTLYLVNDDRSTHEVRVTIWAESPLSANAELAVDRLVPGDTLVLLSSRKISANNSSDATSVWNILARGKRGHIYVDRSNIINFRRVGFPES